VHFYYKQPYHWLTMLVALARQAPPLVKNPLEMAVKKCIQAGTVRPPGRLISLTPGDSHVCHA
jgi:hypothetical protein